MRVRAATWRAALVTAVLACGGLAQAQAPSPAEHSGGSDAAGAPSAPPSSPRPRAFADVIKDATRVGGHFTVYRKDDRVWLELLPAQLGEAFYFAADVARGLGERGLYGNQMGRAHLAYFRRSGERVQLVARNDEFFAAPGTPQSRFVSESFTESLIGSAPLVSLPHPETKALLIDAGALLIADIPGYLTRLEAAFRMPFALDRANSAFARVTNTPQQTVLEVRAHYAVPKLPAPPLKPAADPAPAPPRTLPDARSAFLHFRYSLAQLPAEPMPARAADERIGHFTVARVDYTEDTSPKPRRHFVQRWRLEKKDPQADVSDAREPILFWLDRNIPEKYRRSVADGVLEWNKAFERAGVRNAIVVRQQAGEDEIEQGPPRRAVVRWFTGADVGFAIGPRRADPRTGEILAADIGMSDVFGRGARRLVAEDLGATALATHDRQAFQDCTYAADAAHELEFASDLLEARGVAMDGPEAEALAQLYVKETIMHEVGHVLGLRHNFRASAAYDLRQLRDPAFTQHRGIAASVMDYIPFNLPLEGEPRGDYMMGTLGAYDYWAIEYAYRPLEAGAEQAALARIAARATEPELAFGTDEDAGAEPAYVGIDPDVNRFDLGADPIEYYQRRLRLTQELWARLRGVKPGPAESPERLTRSLMNGLRQVARVAPLVAKYVGGVTHRRSSAGSGRPLYEPVPQARQREALARVTRDFLRSDSFRLAPELLSRVGIDQFERPSNPFLSVSAAVLSVQKPILDHLLSDAVATRLLESPGRVVDGRQVLGLGELHDTLQASIWSEAFAGRDADLLRRNLQREHLKKVAGALLRPAATTPADAVALLRENARRLAGALRAAQSKPGLGRETRAHFAESFNALDEALKAPLQRGSL